MPGNSVLNAALEGTLYQDLPSELPSNLGHHQKPPYYVPSHKIEIYGDTPLHQLLKKQEISYQIDEDSVKIFQAFVNAAKA